MFKRLVTALACIASVSSAKEHVQVKIRSGELASRAANLGGWLLSEYWMCWTSPLYEGVSPSIGITGEYGVMKALGQEQGNKQFEKHWSTWITEDDIAEIAKAGLNTVRVTTGYWIINDEDTTDQSDVVKMYPKGGLKYLDTLINDWAIKYNVAVMVSLHAHKGSQNGMDHSAPVNMGKTAWSDSPENVKSSLNYATFIAKRYKKSPAFLGLNLMNEPTRPTDYPTLLKYYEDAYKAIRADGNDCIIVTSPWLEHQGPPTMADFMPCPKYYNVWHEFHVYYKWGWEQASMDAVYQHAANYSKSHLDGWTGNPIFLGEWSLATADEDKRTDDELTKFAEIQMKEAEKMPVGWAFWAWRHGDETKMTSGWSMRQLIKKGILVVPTTSAKRTPKNPKCVKKTTYDNSSSSSSSGSGTVDKSQLFAPGKVETTPVQSDNTSSNSPSTSGKTATSGAGVPSTVASVVLGAVCMLATLML